MPDREVLRVETHAGGEGPYMAKGINCGPALIDLPDRRPCPWEDKSLKEWWDSGGRLTDYDGARSEYFFGYRDEDELLRWWQPAELAALLEQGMQVSRYLVPFHAVLYGTHQVAFKRGCATYAGKLEVEK